jgi:dipeptidyl aminopeptidase/acylaminoacyl peptidase
VLFTRWSSQATTVAEIIRHSLTGGGQDVVLTIGSSPRYASSGYLLLARSADVLAAPFDIDQSTPVHEPVIVAQQVANLGGSAQYDVSRTGTFVSIPGSAMITPVSQIRRVDATGAGRALGLADGAYSDPRVSPDGRRIALHVTEQQNDVWIGDVARGTLTRVTFDPREDETPVWSPDGAWIAFAGFARKGDERTVFRRRADGSGGEEVLWTGVEHAHVTDWSPDGRFVTLDVPHPERQQDIHVIELGAGPPKTHPFLETPFNEAAARISPDGKWVAYRSTESGRSEIYVQSFPVAGAKTAVSSGGGLQPVWSRDGRALYYRSLNQVMMARVTSQPFSVSAPVPLFKDTFVRPQGDTHTTFDVLPDGQFVFLEAIDTSEASAGNPVVLATFNWFQELKARLQLR